MLTRRLWIATFLLIIFFGSLPAWAQVSAVLSGRVTDQSGAVVSGATVTATSQETGPSDRDDQSVWNVRTAGFAHRSL